MKLLLSNDDGVYAEGIAALATALMDEHELYISAPDRQRSAVSRSMTLFSPLRARETTLPGVRAKAFAVSGTPVDCVRLGLGNLCPAPDVVVSGVNHGPNLGTDVLYSGTVAAAHEAALLGYQAIAVSDCAHNPKHLDTAAKVAAACVRYISAHPLPFGCVLNVNVPDVPYGELKGFKKARTCIERYGLKFVERLDPMGVPYYWPPRDRTTDVCGQDVDERWTDAGYVSLTPLMFDLTAYSLMDAIDENAIR